MRTLSTVGLTDTDGHDAILRPDGSRILVAYEPNAVSGRQDAVIQEVDAQGHEVYTWNSSQHLDPDTETTSTPGTVDYAHINSIEVLPDGDILASFRNLSAVYRIAWSARGNLSRGDIVWRLGGRHSDFTFPDDPDGGPCAQHSAGMLANGHVLVFDNGNAALGSNPGLCVDPADRTGPTVDRGHSRAAEYALDTQAGTASLVWSYARSPPYFAYFAGSARRLAKGNTLIDWAADTHAIATEVTPAGSVAWELKNDDGYLSYRAVKAVVPDTVRPAVTSPCRLPARRTPTGGGSSPGPVHRPRRLEPAHVLRTACSGHQGAGSAHLPGDRDRRCREHLDGDAQLHGGCGAVLPSRCDHPGTWWVGRQQRLRVTRSPAGQQGRAPWRLGHDLGPAAERGQPDRPGRGPRHRRQPAVPGPLLPWSHRLHDACPCRDLREDPVGEPVVRPARRGHQAATSDAGKLAQGRWCWPRPATTRAGVTPSPRRCAPSAEGW